MPTIAVAGATGRLGHLIVKALAARGATVRPLVRPGSPPEKLTGLEGTEITEADYGNPPQLTRALEGVDVVVSALNGLHDVIVGTQSQLLAAAVAARRLPALALTAHGGEDRVRAIRTGFQMHVAKPIDPAKLATVVANLGGRSVACSRCPRDDCPGHRGHLSGRRTSPHSFVSVGVDGDGDGDVGGGRPGV